MSRRTTLAEELAELANPAPAQEFNPDADIFGAGPALVESDDELAAAQLARGSKGKEKARLRGEVVLEGAAYAGKRSSRAALFGGEDSASDGGGSSDEGDGLELAEGAGSSDSEEPEDEEAREAGGGSEPDSDGDDRRPEELGNGLGPRRAAGAESSPSESEGSGRPGAAGAGGEMAALEAEYAAMQAEDAAAVAGLRERAARERRKALAVRAQRALWQRGLELRILLQRALQGGNRLPRAGAPQAAAAAAPALADAYAGLAADAADALEQLCALLDALAEQNAGVAETAATVGQKRGREDEDGREGGEETPRLLRLWARLDAAYAGLAPFRDASVDRWHRKTVLTAGGVARGGSLRVLNQSVSSQVQALLRDPQRLVQRTRLPRGQLHVLCDELAPQEHDHIDGEPSAEDDRDPDTFDDAEFYQTLLQEFLEGSGTAGGGNWYTGPKQRKQVDRRASKGRKLRYHIHDKLVNFTTPVELKAPQFASQLFSNLFGGKR